MKYTALVVAGLVAIVSALYWYWTAPRVLVDVSLCNGVVHLTVENKLLGMERNDFAELTYTKGGQNKLILYFDRAKISYLSTMLKIEKRSYWPIDGNVPSEVIELPQETEDISTYINFFVDPGEFSRPEFNEMAACLKSESTFFNSTLSKSSPRELSRLRLGGLTYSNITDYLQAK